MYKEVSIKEALNAAIDGKTVLAISPLIPVDGAPEVCNITSDVATMLESGDRFIVDYDDPEETEPEIDTPSSNPETVSEISEKPKKERKKPGPKTPPIDVRKIHALANAGWSQGAIASEMHISVATVRKYLTGVAFESKDDEGVRDSKSVYAKIKSLLDSGLSDVQIANELDMPRETVLKYLREEGAKDD